MQSGIEQTLREGRDAQMASGSRKRPHLRRNERRHSGEPQARCPPARCFQHLGSRKQSFQYPKSPPAAAGSLHADQSMLVTSTTMQKKNTVHAKLKTKRLCLLIRSVCWRCTRPASASWDGVSGCGLHLVDGLVPTEDAVAPSLAPLPKRHPRARAAEPTLPTKAKAWRITPEDPRESPRAKCAPCSCCGCNLWPLATC